MMADERGEDPALTLKICICSTRTNTNVHPTPGPESCQAPKDDPPTDEDVTSGAEERPE